MQKNRELKTLKTWSPHDYAFGLPKVELVIVMIATAIIILLGKDYFPWTVPFITTFIYGVVRQRQVRCEFDRFMGRRL